MKSIIYSRALVSVVSSYMYLVNKIQAKLLPSLLATPRSVYDLMLQW